MVTGRFRSCIRSPNGAAELGSDHLGTVVIAHSSASVSRFATSMLGQLWSSSLWAPKPDLCGRRKKEAGRKRKPPRALLRV